MRAFRRYAIGLVAAALAALAFILGMALWLAPIKGELLGDLVRTGWYSNNLWGFRKPMLEFVEPQYEVVESYTGYRDVYVLGDSFSVRPQYSWPNYVAAAGLSLQVVTLGGETEKVVDNLVRSAAFRESPPKVVAYVSVERAFYWRTKNMRPDCNAAVVPRPEVRIDPAPARPLPTRDFLPIPHGNLSEDQITYARDFILKQLNRRLYARSWPVFDFPMTVPRFSSVRADRLLIISDEPEKRDWAEADLAHMRCVLRALQNKVQANGKTLFVVMIVPDKLSIYRADLRDPGAQPETIIPRLEDPALWSVRLDRVLRDAVERGELDVYLPSDTHWGATGHRLAGESLLAFLKERGVLHADAEKARISAAGGR